MESNDSPEIPVGGRQKTPPASLRWLQERKMVNAEWYVNLCPSKVFEAWSARRPNNGTRGLLPHHDNVSAHTAATALNYLEANRVQLVTQTPVFPGFSPL